MKNGFFQFLDGLGLVWNYAMNGLIGGLIWSIYKKSKFWEAFRQIVIGAIVSGYLTPVIIKQTDMNIQYQGALSFVIGMTGMVVIDSVYKWVLRNMKKLKEALIIINNK